MNVAALPLVHRFRGRSLAAVLAGAAPFVLALAVYTGAYLVMDPETYGDEPHYLLVAQSIALDGDIDLRNDYASVDRTLAVTHVFPLEPHAATYTSDALIPEHGLGLSLLLAPAVGLGGETAARLVLILLAALLAHQLYRLLVELGVARPTYRWLAWAAVALSVPLVTFANQVYPEVPGALAIVLALRAVLARAPRARVLLGAGVATAVLPWLHVRYLPIAFALAVGLAWRACTSSRGRGTNRRRASVARRARETVREYADSLRSCPRRVLALAVAPAVVSVAAMLVAFEVLYGSPYPGAPYKPFFHGSVGSGGWTFVYDYFLADILHPGYGWLPYAPVHWLGLAALGVVVVRFGLGALAVTVGALAYALVVASTALPLGFQFPARIVLIVIPLIAVPLAIVLEDVRLTRYVFVPLLAGSLALTAAAVKDHESLYSVAGVREDARLLGVRSIRTAFPDTRPHDPPTRITVRPGDFPPQVGQLDNGRAVASALEGDSRGVLVYGPHATVARAVWAATFSLAGESPRGDAPLATLEVVVPGEIVLARRPVYPHELEARGEKEVVVPFATPQAVPIDARVVFEGHGRLAAGPIEIDPHPVSAQARERFPDWPLALLWVGGTLIVGALLVQLVRTRR